MAAVASDSSAVVVAVVQPTGIAPAQGQSGNVVAAAASAPSAVIDVVAAEPAKCSESIMQVQTWLKDLGVDQAVRQVFLEEEMDVQAVQVCTAEDLKTLGVGKMGMQIKLRGLAYASTAAAKPPPATLPAAAVMHAMKTSKQEAHASAMREEMTACHEMN